MESAKMAMAKILENKLLHKLEQSKSNIETPFCSLNLSYKNQFQKNSEKQPRKSEICNF